MRIERPWQQLLILGLFKVEVHLNKEEEIHPVVVRVHNSSDKQCVRLNHHFEVEGREEVAFPHQRHGLA